MNGKDINPIFSLFDTYISLEKEILKRVSEISKPFCFKCQTKCCEEKICRESVESKFLSSLIKFQNIQYDQKNGWISSQGCRLDYGRPLVCYEFFCDKILIEYNFHTLNIQQAIKEFINIGNRAYGNTHLICVDNLKKISTRKILEITNRTWNLVVKLANHANSSDTKSRAAD
jgi:hypothetical protein